MGSSKMGLPRCTSSLMMGAQLLFSFALVGALNVNPLRLQEARYHDLDANSTLASSCQRFLCIKDGTSSSSGVYPWLINNNNARFAYVRTDSEGYATYSYTRLLSPLLRRGSVLQRVLGGQRPRDWLRGDR